MLFENILYNLILLTNIFPSITGDCNFTFCPQTINIQWWPIPPYILKDTAGKVVGLLPKILEEMVQDCCGGCSKIFYEYQHPSENALLNNLTMKKTGLYTPVFGSMQTNKIALKPYIPLIESTGIMYFIDDIKTFDSFSSVVITALSRAWPLICFILCSAMVSGVVVWALDCYWNPHQFPVNFFKGSWDGFWWACVSMTTIGYGDRVPKSFSARIAASIWILFGLVIFASLNGAMTAALTSASIAQQFIVGEQILVLDGTAEKSYSLYANVDAIAVDTVEELADGLKNRQHIKGVMLDAYHAGYYDELFSLSNGIRLLDIIEHHVAYGFILNGDYANSKMQECFFRFASLKNDFIVDTVLKNTKTSKPPKISLNQKKSSQIISPRSSWFIYLISFSCGLLLLICIIGIIWQHKNELLSVFKRKEKKLTKRKELFVEEPFERTLEELLQRQNLELMNEMENEVNRFLLKWNQRKDAVKQLSFVEYAKCKQHTESPKYTYVP